MTSTLVAGEATARAVEEARVKAEELAAAEALVTAARAKARMPNPSITQALTLTLTLTLTLALTLTLSANSDNSRPPRVPPPGAPPLGVPPPAAISAQSRRDLGTISPPGVTSATVGVPA